MTMPVASEYIAAGLSFEKFKRDWHAAFCDTNDPSAHSMYWDGQFDELPYAEWEDAGGFIEENQL